MKIKSLIIAVSAVFGLLSCTGGFKEDLGAPALSLSTSTLSFTQEASAQDLTIKATREWMVDVTKEELPEWISVSPMYGEGSAESQAVKVTVTKNEGMERTADVKFTIGMVSRTLTVSQAGPGGSLADQIVYKNDFDKAPATEKPYLKSSDVWKHESGTGISGVEYEYVGTLSARQTGKLSNAEGFTNYEGSGYNKVFFGAATSILKVKNIALNGKKDFRLSFGGQKYGQDEPDNTFSKNDFKVYVSNDASKWVELDYNVQSGEGVDLDGNWGLMTADISVPAGTEKLSIAFACSVSSLYSLDDVLLALSSEAGKEISFSNGIALEEGVGDDVEVDPSTVEQITCAEFIKRADSNTTYRLVGEVVSSVNTTYCSFDMNDGTGKVVVWTVVNKADWANVVKKGGTVTVRGKYLLYGSGENAKHEMVDAYIEKFEPGSDSGSDTEPTPDNAIFYESFASDLGDFTIDNKQLPSGLDAIWEAAPDYKCAKATAYKDSQNNASESWLVSPEIDLTGKTQAYLTFEHAGQYFGDVKNEIFVMISKADGNWVELPIEDSNYPSSWSFISAGGWNLDQYVGGKIQVAFKYVSTAEKAGTWEVKNVGVYEGTYVEEEEPEVNVPDEPEGTKVVLLTNETMNFTAKTDPTYGAGFSADKDGIIVGYYKHKSTTTAIEAKSDHIRVYKNSALVISVPDADIKYVKLVTTGGDHCEEYSISSGKIVKDGADLYWTGSMASPWIAEATGSQLRIKEITVVYKQSGQSTPSPVTGWLELPEVADADKDSYYAHHFSMNDASYRNYSFLWSASDRVAPWVAYPLCSMHTTKTVNRSDDWQYDPKVAEGTQPELYSGFATSGYDRGHQIPSADRLCCYEANAQTFYFTNMTPQLSGLNQQSWADLEGQVRTWSNSLDTLYVVTGCIPEGSTAKAQDKKGNNVTIPTGYYKALLGYKKTATIGAQTGGFVGIAFYFDHKTYSSYQTQKMTIKELETKTGINFFVNLPDKIGETLAGQVEENIDSWWGM